MVDTRSRALRIGDRYEVGPMVGSGGMGQVFRAYDTRLDRVVAIKVLRDAASLDRRQRMRFEQEALLTAGINHPNVVSVYDVGDDEGEVFIVMEYLPGPTLAEDIAAGPISGQRVRRIAIELLGALGAAHAHGVLHRDVKPSNILFTDTGAAKLGDFGIAKHIDSLDLTNAGDVIGTARYLPPERLSGHAATEAGDLYAVGVVLYEALAGRAPFEGDSPIVLAQAIASSNPIPIEQLRPDVDPQLARIIGRAMDPEPTRRFANAGTMAATLGARPVITGPPSKTTAADPGLAHAELATGAAAAEFAIASTEPARISDTPVTPDSAPTQLSPPPTATMPSELIPISPDGELNTRPPPRRRIIAAVLVASIAVVTIIAGILIGSAIHRGSAPSTTRDSSVVTTGQQPTTATSSPTTAAPPSTYPPTTPSPAPPGRGSGKGKGHG